jgi:hypothetical protein
VFNSLRVSNLRIVALPVLTFSGRREISCTSLRAVT